MVNTILSHIHEISYWINMALFVPVPFLLCMSMMNVRHIEDRKQKLIVFGTGIFGVLAVCLFVIAQASWMVFNHGSKLPSWAENVWALFDFANVAFYLLGSLSLYIQTNWIKNRSGFEKNKHLFFCDHGDVCDVRGKGENATGGSERPKNDKGSLAKEIH